MSDTTMTKTTSAARAVVAGFYSLLAAGDAEGIVSLVEDNFAGDAVLTRPESLPGGGATGGRDRIVRFVRGAARAGLPVAVNGIYETATPDGVSFFADVTADLGKGPVKALEWWTFNGDKVATLQAYYWDTAAILAE